MSNIIYDDLEIDHADSMSDIDAFNKRVHAKADELREIMRSSNSVQDFLGNIKPTKIQENVKQAMMAALADVYSSAELAPIEELDEYITFAKKLVGDLETLKWWKAGNIVAQTTSILDKRTAHEQYMRLHKAYNAYCEAITTLGLGAPEKLKSMPGNYGATAGLPQYIFFEGDSEEGYRNHFAVAKKLNVTFKNLMDAVDYVRNNPDCGYTVKEVQS